jgi:hypothetical protein
MPELPYNYFVSYAHSRGFGNLQIRTDLPVDRMDHVNEFRLTIGRISPVDGIVVLWWKRLPGDEPSASEEADVEIESAATGFEQAANRYRRASKMVELAAGVLISVMAIVLLTLDGPWVGGVALAILLAAVVVYLAAWPLQRRASDARMEAMETRWAAARAEQDGGRG